MLKPHKHADLIKAWADGAEIQVKITRTGEWIDVINFNWSEDYEFRIKPEEKKSVVLWLWAYCDPYYSWKISDYLTEDQADVYFSQHKHMKLEWSRIEVAL